MVRVVFWLLMILVVGFFSYQNVQHPQLAYNRPIDKLLHPMDTRVRYRFGDIDPRFGLSQDEVRQLTDEAVQIWHGGTGKQWFVYDDNARLTINFIYDERQATTVAKQQTEQKITQDLNQHNAKSLELTDQKQRLDLEFKGLETRLKAWQTEHNEAYHRLQTNQNPDLHATLYAQYERTLLDKRRLDNELATFYTNQRAYNDKVGELNANAERVNQSINEANAKFTPRQFHKGVFNGKRIEIYEFSSRDDLRLVLAHELGHALGIDHNDDPTALMYPMMSEQKTKNFQLKAADIALLNNRDGIWQKRAFGEHDHHHHHDHAH